MSKAECRKFAPNVFNKNKCASCFKAKEEHSDEALENNRVSSVLQFSLACRPHSWPHHLTNKSGLHHLTCRWCVCVCVFDGNQDNVFHISLFFCLQKKKKKKSDWKGERKEFFGIMLGVFVRTSVFLFMSGKSSFERWRRGCNRRVSLDRVFIQPERYIPIVSSQWVVRHSYLWRCCRRDKRLHNEQFRLEITWHRHQNWWAPFLKKLSTSPYYQQTRRQTNQQTKEKETEKKSRARRDGNPQKASPTLWIDIVYAQ